MICTHFGLSNYLSWCAEAYGVEEGTGAPVHSPLGFDLTITSIFPPLLAGQSIVLVPEDKRFEGLSSALGTAGDFSLVKITPSHLEVLNQILSPEQMAGTTKAFIIGGEALNSETLSTWRTAAPDVRLINEYGPTETVVGCCVYEVAPEDPYHGPVPIGRAIANTQLYLLDKYLNPVPVGVTGELYISGDGLARGYLGRPELTAEGSYRILSARWRACGFIALETSLVTVATGSSSIWAASISKSRFAASGSSWVKSKRH